MALDTRVNIDTFFSSLANPVASSDVSMTLQSIDVAQLDAVGTLDTTRYLPLVLLSPTTRQWEVVYAVGHTAGSAALTIQRGKEGTAAAAWAGGTLVLCGPLARDVLFAASSGSMPSGAYVGMRVKRHDKNDVASFAKGSIWVPGAGGAFAEDVGGSFSAGSPPAGSAILHRHGSGGGTTSGTGALTSTFATPFPTACGGVAITSTFVAAGGGLPVLSSIAGGTSFTVRMINSDGSSYVGTWSYVYTAWGW